MFLSLALVPGSRCVSLVPVSGPKCVLFTGSGFRAKVDFFGNFFTVYPAVTLMCPTRMSGSFTR